MKICVVTLGCPKNIVDSEYLAAMLFDNKVEFVDHADQSDVVIINTCAFIDAAREEAIEVILEAVHLKEKRKTQRVYVAGCLPQRYIDELQKEIPEVDGFFAEYDFPEIGRKLAYQLKLKNKNSNSRKILQTPGHYRYLKISDGCDNRCNYCTIPIIKGGYRDRSINDLIDEAWELADNGVRELILIAQDTTYYGWKQGNKELLCDLIRSLAKIEQLKWIRILYAHPAHIDDHIIQLYNEQEKLCRYIDIPIQHISDKILKSMGRHVSERDIRRLISKLRENVPDIAIRTTLMVGYPGEESQDFELLKDFIITTEFERLGVFKYSHEEGTYAAQLSNQVEEQVKEDRFEEIMELQAEISMKKNRQLINRTLSVMIDERDGSDTYFLGRTEWDSPAIDNTVHVIGNVKVGNFYPVTINHVTDYDLWGETKDAVL